MKLIREVKGHSSNAIDKYAVTSHAQRTHISNVLAGTVDDKKQEREPKNVVAGHIKLKNRTNSDSEIAPSCTCSKQFLKQSETHKLYQIINDIVNAKKGVKTAV